MKMITSFIAKYAIWLYWKEVNIVDHAINVFKALTIIVNG